MPKPKKTVASFSICQKILKRAQEAAKLESRSYSNWAELAFKEKLAKEPSANGASHAGAK